MRSKEFDSDFGEVKVRTTLDAALQRIAVRAVGNAGIGDAQAALVAMRPDGRVVAMVGGRSYRDSPFNRATQARRQPGSAFKLFVYLAALRSGWTPDSMIEDRPITIDGWTPVNSDGVYRGNITVREAFARSSNAATVRLSQAIGRDNVIRAARDLGITTPLPDKPSLALGTAGVSLLELTSAYAAVASGALSGGRARACRGAAARGAVGLLPQGRTARGWPRPRRRCSTCSTPRRTTAPAAARRWRCRRSARPAPRRRTATRCSSASPATWWSAVWVGPRRQQVARQDQRRHGSGDDLAQLHDRGARRRPAARTRFADRVHAAPATPEPQPHPDLQSPLPPEWSDGTRELREMRDALEQLFNQ